VSDLPLVFVDGTGQGIEVLDRGLHFGDGLFETIACVHGKPRFLELHLQRLALGCERLRIPLSATDGIITRVNQLAAGGGRCIVKVLITRGVAVARGYAASGAERPTCVTIRYPWPADHPAIAEAAVRVRILQMRLGENPQLAGLKHCNRLEQILARSEWTDPQQFEGLLFSQSGALVSGTMSNVFLVAAGELLTPLLDRCGVAGVMRAVVMREAQRIGVSVRECRLPSRELQSVTELFLTNARIGLVPVNLLDERRLSVGPLTRRLQETLAPLLGGPVDA
jgi:4-amino-4-deoxychorismate lyase